MRRFCRKGVAPLPYLEPPADTQGTFDYIRQLIRQEMAGLQPSPQQQYPQQAQFQQPQQQQFQQPQQPFGFPQGAAGANPLQHAASVRRKIQTRPMVRPRSQMMPGGAQMPPGGAQMSPGMTPQMAPGFGQQMAPGMPAGAMGMPYTGDPSGETMRAMSANLEKLRTVLRETEGIAQRMEQLLWAQQQQQQQQQQSYGNQQQGNQGAGQGAGQGGRQGAGQGSGQGTQRDSGRRQKR